MPPTDQSSLAVELSRRMHDACDDLTAEWLVRISERVTLPPDRIFPTEELLDHIPLLVKGIAAYLADPAAHVTNDTPVVSHAMELGALRHSQGFDESEVLKEFQILGEILLGFIAHEADRIEEPCSRSELLNCALRVHGGVSLIHMAAVTQFLQLLRQRLTEREDRLHAFNRALSHEFRNRIGAAEGAATLLNLPTLANEERVKLRGVLTRNLWSMRSVIENLVELSFLGRDDHQRRAVRLGAAVGDAVRLLSETAVEQNVSVEIVPEIPDVEVSMAIELVLVNLIGNAVKYSDASKAQRWVRVGARLEEESSLPGDDGSRILVVEVTDNGRGVPEGERGRIFERFYRASGTRDGVEGSGLGLTIVQDVVRSLGGRVWVSHPDEGGSSFAFSLPVRSEHLPPEAARAS